MKHLALVAALVACGKHAPHRIATPISVTKALDVFGVSLQVYSETDDKLMADGMFTLAVTRLDTPGAIACQGSIEVAKTAYDEVEKTATFDLRIAGCPPYQPRTFAVISRFAPKGGAKPIEHSYQLDQLAPTDPPAPEQQRSAAIDKACGAGDRVRAEALRSEIADQVTRTIQSLQAPLRDALAALLHDKDPCKRTFGVYAHDLAFDDKPDWDIKYGGAETFGHRVHAAHWPDASAVANELTRRLADKGAGWLVVTHAPDDTIPATVIQYTVSTDGKITSAAAKLTLREEVGLMTPIPGEPTPLLPLVIQAFDTTGPPATMDAMATELSAKVDLMARLDPGSH